MAKKRKKKVKHNNGKKLGVLSKNPRIFFKQIGIKPLVKPNEEGSVSHMEKQVVRLFGEEFLEKLNEAIKNSNRAYDYYHSDLNLAKIWYGADFNRICCIAEELSHLDVPEKASILDVGGGSGHLAFWLANIWNPATVTVADDNTVVGPLWAKEINENRVDFVKSKLPELDELNGREFDVIFLSRVLSVMEGLNLPSYVADFQGAEAQRLLAYLEKIGNRLKELVKTQGQIIVLESWSDHRVLLVGKAFEKAGLYVNPHRFIPERVGLGPSVIVFSRCMEPVPLKDRIYSLSTVVRFPAEPQQYSGTAAESLRVLFGDGEIKAQFEYESKARGLTLYNEILEKEGLILVFISDSGGGKGAWIFPGISILHLMRQFDESKNDLIAEDCVEMNNAM